MEVARLPGALVQDCDRVLHPPDVPHVLQAIARVGEEMRPKAQRGGPGERNERERVENGCGQKGRKGRRGRRGRTGRKGRRRRRGRKGRRGGNGWTGGRKAGSGRRHARSVQSVGGASVSNGRWLASRRGSMSNVSGASVAMLGRFVTASVHPRSCSSATLSALCAPFA